MQDLKSYKKKVIEDLEEPIKKLSLDQLRSIVALFDNPAFMVLVSLKNNHKQLLKDLAFNKYIIDEYDKQIHSSQIGQAVGMDYFESLIEIARAELEKREEKKDRKKENKTNDRLPHYNQ